MSDQPKRYLRTKEKEGRAKMNVGNHAGIVAAPKTYVDQLLLHLIQLPTSPTRIELLASLQKKKQSTRS